MGTRKSHRKRVSKIHKKTVEETKEVQHTKDYIQASKWWVVRRKFDVEMWPRWVILNCNHEYYQDNFEPIVCKKCIKEKDSQNK